MKAWGVLLVGAVLAGCGGGDPGAAPVALPPVSGATSAAEPAPGSSAAPAPSPLPAVLPPRPPELDAPTDLGAAATAKYWIESIAAAQAAVDPSGLEAMSDPGCLACQRHIKAIGDAAAAGRTFRGGIVSKIQSVSAPIEGTDASVLLNYDVTKLDVLDAGGGLFGSVEGDSNVALEFDLKFRNGLWVIMDVVNS